MRQRPDVGAVHRLQAVAMRLREEQARSIELQAALFAAESRILALEAQVGELHNGDARGVATAPHSGRSQQ